MHHDPVVDLAPNLPRTVETNSEVLRPEEVPRRARVAMTPKRTAASSGPRLAKHPFNFVQRHSYRDPFESRRLPEVVSECRGETDDTQENDAEGGDDFGMHALASTVTHNGLQFTGANRDAMKPGTRWTVEQRFASGATAELVRIIHERKA